MKLFLCLATTLTLSQVCFGESLDDMKAATALHKKLSKVISLMENVNGIGITGCDPETGLQSDFQKDFVSCVSLNTVTDEAAKALETLFPAGKKVSGVFIVVRAIGEISIQPGIKTSN